MIPSFGQSLIKDAALFHEIHAQTTEALELEEMTFAGE
jgi:hypothetical protein